EFNVVDALKAEVLKTITLPTGSRPMHAAVSAGDQPLYLSNGRAGTGSASDTPGYRVLDSVKGGPRPWGIGVAPDGKYLFSANGPSNDVSVVDLAAGKEIHRVKAGSSPWGVTVAQTARK